MKLNQRPNEDELLSFLDGELPEKRQNEIREMLEKDWELRNQCSKLRYRILQFVDLTSHHSPHSSSDIPTQDEMWNDFVERFQKNNNSHIDTQNNCTTKIPQERRFLKSFKLPATIAATLMIMFTLIFFIKQENTVSAEELLHQAIKTESTRTKNIIEPVIHRKYKITRSSVGQTEATTWESWNNNINGQFKYRPASKDKSAQIIDDLMRIYKVNELEIRDPLSASGFKLWRNKIGKKRESVILNKDTLILKVTAEGQQKEDSIIESSLTVRINDWQPVAKTIRVLSDKNDYLFELTETVFEPLSLKAAEVFDETSDSSDSALILPTTSKTISEIGSSPASILSPPSASELIDAEIEARFLIHTEREDLGGLIEFLRNQNNTIVVRGIVNNNQIKKRLIEKLGNIPFVVAELQTVEETLKPGIHKGGNRKIIPIKIDPGLNDESFNGVIVRYFEKDTQEKINRLSHNVVSEANNAISEAWALRRLYKRFDSQTELSAASKERIKQIINDHIHNLKSSNREISNQLGPILKSIIANHSSIADSGKYRSLNKAESIFESTSRVQKLINQVFAGNNNNEPVEISARKLLEALAEMEAALK